MTTQYKEFKIGDIITTYHKGYWRLIKIQRRFLTEDDIKRYDFYKNKNVGDEETPLFVYELVMDSKFNTKHQGKKMECDASYCNKVDIPLVKKKAYEEYLACCKNFDKLAKLIVEETK